MMKNLNDLLLVVSLGPVTTAAGEWSEKAPGVEKCTLVLE
jgi:hypothetical protein